MNLSPTLFGLSATIQALLLAALVGGAVLLLVGVSVNNPLLWRMGVRNMRRRRAQTLVMLCGLLLSSIFLTVSFGLQDSFSHSIAADRLTKVGAVDEAVTGPFTQAQVDSLLAQIRQQVSVQAATALYLNPVAASFQVQRTGITETNQYILALPPDFDRVYGTLSDSQGQAVSMASLRSTEVLLSRSAAKSLNVRPGDRLRVSLNGYPGVLEATVHALLANDPVVTGGELAFDGSYPEIILPLATLQQFRLHAVQRPLPPNTICIRNVGPGAMQDSQDSQAVVGFLERLLHTSSDTRGFIPTYFDSTIIHPLKPHWIEDFSWNPIASKGDFLTSAAARQFDLLLPVFTGLLVSAGMLLLILLCLLLAAERRMELGLSRAVGLQRHHLVQVLLIECCGYSLLAAVPGVLLGLGVLELELLTLTNIPALSFTSAAGVPLHLWINWQSVLSVPCIGILTTLVVTFLTALWISHTNVVTAIRDLDDPPRYAQLKELLDEWTTAPTAARRCVVCLRLLWTLFARGPLCLLAGYLLWQWHPGADWLQHLGVAVLIAGAGLCINWLCSVVKLPPSFGRWLGGTMIGLCWLIYGLQMGAGMILLVFTTTAPPLNGIVLQDMLLSLLLPLIGMVVLVMNNNDGLASILHLVLQQVRALAPISRPGTAYPLTFRFRTGVAVSLLSLVLFLVMLIITNNLGIGQQVADTARQSDTQLIATQNAYTTSITRFLVAYLVIGLLFSALSIGVIASRAVVERRQQIGMLRALGFSRALVRRAFLLETSFVVTLSLVISTTLAWWLVSQIAHATARDFLIPVLPTLGLLLGCYLVSFVCTFIPAQRASAIVPAEALRYE